MSDPTTFDTQAAHRHFAAKCFNAAWELIDKAERTADEDDRMLRLTLASLYHWEEREDVTDTNLSIGYWQASRVFALLGLAEPARRYGERCRAVSGSLAPLYRAYALEALARAEAVAGNRAEAGEYVLDALAVAEGISEPDERQMVSADLNGIARLLGV